MTKEIVFCDRSPYILRLYKENFKIRTDRTNYPQHYFMSIHEAEKYVECHHEKIGVFVCGLHMKDKSGYEIALNFLNKYPLMPLVILTTDVLSELSYDVGNLANVLYVDKKENINALRDVVDFLLINLEDLRLSMSHD